MSRIGKQPIPLPDGVKVTITDERVTVEGPKATLSQPLFPEVTVVQQDNLIIVDKKERTIKHSQMHGLMRTLIANMVTGVSEGFTKHLELKGVGYRAEIKGSDLVLHLGFSHPVIIKAPEGISFAVEKNTTSITIAGSKKELVGQIAAKIRAYRKPEPYKGKGIYYVTNGKLEHIVRKEGKRAGAK